MKLTSDSESPKVVLKCAVYARLSLCMLGIF